MTLLQRRSYQQLQKHLLAVVSLHDPSRSNLSADPLCLRWRSESISAHFYAVVAFRTLRSTSDVVLLELAAERGLVQDRFPYVLRPAFSSFRPGAWQPWHDIALCCHLAMLADDWSLAMLTLGPVQADDPFIFFRVVSARTLSLDELSNMAAHLKEEQRVLRAMRVAQGTTKKQKRKRTEANPPANKRTKQQRAAGQGAFGPVSSAHRKLGRGGGANWAGSGDEESSCSSWSLSEEGAEDEKARKRARVQNMSGSASSSGKPEAKPHQRRAIAWGPFQLAPIVPQTGLTGWGAICGCHADRQGSKTSCKKAVSVHVLTEAEAVLRLKRWLLAGLSDDDWPAHRLRSHHVSMGGKHLEDFSEGLSEEEMDLVVSRLGAK